MDIIRDTVPDAVESCKQAGVRVRMVTGDSIVTAIAIAKMCGILDPDWQETPDQKTCMTGKEFDKFVGGLVHTKTGERITVQGKDPKVEKIANGKNMEIIRKQLKVLARSSP
jgi:Ca2+ transporting ATPase